MVEEMIARANEDAQGKRRGKGGEGAFELGVGDERWLITVDKGTFLAAPRSASATKPARTGLRSR